MLHAAGRGGSYKACGNAKTGQSVRQKVKAAAVYSLLRDDMPAVLRKGFNGISDCCSTRSKCQSRNAAFKSGYSLFQNLLSGVSQPAVNVSGVGKTKAGGGMCTVVKDI